MTRAQAAGLDWAQIEPLTETVLESRLYGRPEVAGQRQRPWPECAWIHAERAKPGVTLELLHLEYLERHPDGYRYTQFCDIYRRWLKRRGLSMRQVHRAGEKMFVDYAGQKPVLRQNLVRAARRQPGAVGHGRECRLRQADRDSKSAGPCSAPQDSRLRAGGHARTGQPAVQRSRIAVYYTA